MIGCLKPHLQDVSVGPLELCMRLGITHDTQWLPGEENVRTDLVSRFIDKDEWAQSLSVFCTLEKKWGPHSIDRYSSHHNNQLVKFILSAQTLSIGFADGFMVNRSSVWLV